MSEVLLYASNNNRQIVYDDVVWDTAHDAASGEQILDTYNDPIYYVVGGGATQTARFFIYRGFLTFDASAYIGATLNTLVLDIYPVTVYQTSSEPYPNIQITEGVQADPPTLANYGDQLAYTTVWGEARYDSLTIGQYSPITFGATGITAVQAVLNSNGIIKLCIRAELDVADQTPPLGSNWSQFHSAQKGGDFRPRLTMGYSQSVYPTESITRVTSLIHRYARGVYNLTVGLGEVIADFGIPLPDTLTRPSYQPLLGEPQLPGRGYPRVGISPAGGDQPLLEPTALPSAPMPSRPRPGIRARFPTVTPGVAGEPFDREPVSEQDLPSWIMEPAVTTTQRLWRGITPWREEAGETFPSAVGGMIRTVKRFLNIEREGQRDDWKRNWRGNR